LEYPKELHDLHNDYPLALERLAVEKVEKLIPHLRDKTLYVVHHTALKQYLSLGMKLKKTHHDISFHEEAWMKFYIDKNTNLRAEKGASEFEKAFYKSMNNSVFGKTMENIRKRINFSLETNQKSLERKTSKPNFEKTDFFDENLVGVHMKKTESVFHKPVYISMGIRDISKTLMYDFHYNYMKKNMEKKV